MALNDWRTWVAQGGGMTPATAQPPPAASYTTNVVFPGVNPITDLINMTTSIPPYPSLSNPGNWATVKPVDPFGGWTDQQETLSKVMRPAIAGLTSP
jgi:hypothetical protein